MSRKKKVQVRARKVKSTGVWIAPDLERKIKGEGGRRGLTEPPYSYYLHLADLALKSEPTPHTSPAKSSRHEPDPWFESSIMRTRRPGDSPRAEGDSILLTHFSVSVPPKPQKMSLPKPPKTPSTPKPAKRLATKPLRRQAPKKLSLPKPPKRGQ